MKRTCKKKKQNNSFPTALNPPPLSSPKTYIRACVHIAQGTSKEAVSAPLSLSLSLNPPTPTAQAESSELAWGNYKLPEERTPHLGLRLSLCLSCQSVLCFGWITMQHLIMECDLVWASWLSSMLTFSNCGRNTENAENKLTRPERVQCLSKTELVCMFDKFHWTPLKDHKSIYGFFPHFSWGPQSQP
jgi:hypothetical protein